MANEGRRRRSLPRICCIPTNQDPSAHIPLWDDLHILVVYFVCVCVCVCARVVCHDDSYEIGTGWMTRRMVQ